MNADTPAQSRLDETIIYKPSPALTQTAARSECAHVEFVAGTGPELSRETQSLLQVRLRAVATVLFAAVGVFFIRNLFLDDAPVRTVHALVLAVLGGSVAFLWRAKSFSLMQLRIAEIALFALTCLFLAVYQYQLVLIKTAEGNPVYELAAVKSCVLYFFAVIMLYGTFIPNTPKRAACVIIPMTLVPGIVMFCLSRRLQVLQEYVEKIANFEQISDHLIMLWLGAAASIYATHIVHRLRQEAFQARQLGQYHLKQRIGAGGMGEVYLAEHKLLKRPCAIKIIRPCAQTDPTALARFEREVRTTAKLSHWNTIDVFDYGHTEDGTFYYVMEFLPGLNLADLVKHYGPMPAPRVIHLLRQTCQALREAHGIGLIHRDIKPANIFAAKRGGVFDVAKLLDFGLVKQTVSDQTNVQLSREGTLSGSPLFMSPEQAATKGDPDARSDIYSLGATAYFLLTGRVPFDGDNPVQVLIAHARDPVTPPSQWQSDIPADLEQVVLRCLEKDPADRFPDVESLEAALAQCADANAWNDDDATAWWHGTSGALQHTTHATV